MIRHDRNQLVLGKGRVFFERFGPSGFVGDGERYIGNTDLFNVTTNETRQERKGVRGGLLVAQGSELIEQTCTGTMVTDSISVANVADWFNVESIGVTASAAPVAREVIVQRGLYYQLGVTPTNPMGRRDFTSVTVTLGGNVVPAANNYEFDLVTGQIRFLANAANVVDGDAVIIGGSPRATSEVIMSPTGAIVRGALRFVANAMIGQSTDLYIPCVEMRSDGDREMKADKWQELRFRFNAIHRPTYNLYYVAKRAA